MPKRGKFIVFEGGEGSGKDTQINLLKADFPDAVFTREPGGTKLGTQLRQILLASETGDIDALTELFLFSASRVQFIKEVVQPAIDQGKMVVSNRFALSTIAYQIYGRQQDELLSFAQEVIKKSIGTYSPDLTILLDIDPEYAAEYRVDRRAEENTRFDEEKMAFHQRVRDGYIKHIKDFGAYKIIDSNPNESDEGGSSVAMSPEQIHRIALRKINEILSA